MFTESGGIIKKADKSEKKLEEWKRDLDRLHSTGNLYVIRMKEFQGELRKSELLKDVFDEQISLERQT